MLLVRLLKTFSIFFIFPPPQNPYKQYQQFLQFQLFLQSSLNQQQPRRNKVQSNIPLSPSGAVNPDSAPQQTDVRIPTADPARSMHFSVVPASSATTTEPAVPMPTGNLGQSAGSSATPRSLK